MDINILVVEDNKTICDTVKTFLQNEGFLVDTAFHGDVALEMFYDKSYQLLILDIMLPGIDGHELLKAFRKISTAPVLMMTALSDDLNQLIAFQNEVDDYVTKPFSMQILIKRVEALLRRSGVLQKEICVGGLLLNIDSYKAIYDDTAIALTLREFEILLLLAQNKGKVITHQTILTRIWGYDFDGEEGVIHTHIKNLRAKLPVNIIKTIRGIGYSLEDVR
ncbi:response regulator transcription factor [Fusibacter ferrireducens]|uniref:Stage 0 sporulation protein A homolog n=1 Tax=Fusibacter ferrireducens TaxID=2785058 RepID=A0ABR9ZQJ9_9FIRM|nr:response regulator transcription factor [Fusibacter ferrireducens]MBF4691909.1 response regulator transcription factor [Fusibacter ferrireducens]